MLQLKMKKDTNNYFSRVLKVYLAVCMLPRFRISQIINNIIISCYFPKVMFASSVAQVAMAQPRGFPDPDDC